MTTLMFYPRRFRFGSFALIVLAALLAGCGADDSTNAAPGAPGTPGLPTDRSIFLTPFADETELVQFVKEAGTSADSRSGAADNLPVIGAPDAAVGSPGAGAGAGAPENASTTNIQEPGVDEPDVVKNDGRYIYSAVSGGVAIVSTLDAPQLSLAATIDVPGRVSGLLLTAEQQLTVLYSPYEPPFAAANSRVTGPYGNSGVLVLDVSDAANPVVQRRLEFQGSISAVRRVDNTLYLVLNWMTYLDLPILSPGLPDDTVVAAAADTTEIAPLPRYRELDGEGAVLNSGPMVAATDVFHPEQPRGTSMVVVLGLNLANNQSEFNSKAYLGQVATTYASASALYLVDTQWSGEVVAVDPGPIAVGGGVADVPVQVFRAVARGPATVIHKFSLAADQVALSASGEVPGTLLNQYSLSEAEGFLRVATSPGWNQGADVFVLEPEGGELVEAGSVRNIEPDEHLYAARFMDDRGYLVTFERVDPLITLDLSDPRAPRLVGELVVPGFSQYLHPLDRDHLLGIGREVDPEAERPVPGGIQLSSFDVSQFADPALLDRAVIGGMNSYSEVLFNPRALVYWPAERLLVLPVTDWSSDNFAPVPGGRFEGLYVFHLTSAGLFEHVGTLARDAGFSANRLRGIFIGERLYAVSDFEVTVAALSDVAQVESTLVLDDGGDSTPPVVFPE